MRDAVVAVTKRELGTRPTAVDRLTDGLLHDTFAVECDDREFVVQFGTEDVDDAEDSLRRGLHCYLAFQDAPVPVPKVVTDDVRTIDGRPYTVVEKLPGESGKLDVSPDRVRNAGQYLAKIHEHWTFDRAGRLSFDDGSTVTNFEAGSHGRWILETVAESAETLESGSMETAGSELRRTFDRVGDDLPTAFDPVLCHDDFSPDNVLYRGDEVTGVIDFDRAYAGHAHRDLAHSANAFWMHDPGADWEIRATLHEGYREVRTIEGSFERNERLYRVETLARTVAGMESLGELSAYERDFYEERLLDAIDRV